MVVGGWLILVDGGRLIGFGCEIWDGYEILVDGVFFLCVGVDIGSSVCLRFFFLVAVADIGGRWLWAVAVDLRCGLLFLLLLLMIMEEGIIYYFNV